jgi:hypothetical protein
LGAYGAAPVSVGGPAEGPGLTNSGSIFCSQTGARKADPVVEKAVDVVLVASGRVGRHLEGLD